jgi:hypothetical protein
MAKQLQETEEERSQTLSPPEDWWGSRWRGCESMRERAYDGALDT